jgi:putative ABC transport system ATP-binding protein
MIKITDLKFTYAEGGFHLDVAKLAVQRGEAVAVVGASGTGKTTLLNLIAGVAVADTGRIQTNGSELTALDDSARRDFRIQNIGLIFQEFELLEYCDVLDNIMLPYRISKALPLTPSIRKRALDLAALVGIDDKIHRHINQLSQGERQRVAICRALLPDPSLILADEPTGNLDPENTARVLDIVSDYVKSNQSTLVCVTHDRALLARFDRVVDFADFRKEGRHA